MSLPIFQTQDKNASLMQTSWASQLNPLLLNPIVNGNILNSISLVTGSNTINHLLSRKLQGWFLIGINEAAQIYDAQSTNQAPDKTLILISDASCVVNLYVF